MSGIRNLVSRLAREDDDQLGEPVAMVPETEAQAPADQAELVAADTEVATTVEAIEEASEDIEGLEAVQDVVEDSVEPEVAGGAEGPGMEPVAAALATEAIARIRHKYRLGTVGASMPALESFGRSSSRKQATRLALLGIGDTIKGIWERIKAFFKGLWEKIKMAVKSIFQSNMRTATRAKSLLDELNKNASKYAGTPKEELKSEKICKAFNDGGKTSATIANEIISRHVKTTDISKALMTEAAALGAECKKAVDAIKVIAENKSGAGAGQIGTGLANEIKNFVTKMKAKVSSLGSLPNDALNQIKKEITSGDSDVKDADIEVFGYGPLLNSRFFTISIVTKTEKDKKFVGEIVATDFSYKKVSISTTELDIKYTSSIKALTATEMRAICDEVLRGTKEMAAAERDAKLGDTVSREVMAVIDSVINLADKTLGNDGTRHGTEIRSYITMVKQVNDTVMKSVGQAGAAMNILAMSSYNYGLDFVSGSMKLYK